MTQFRRRLSEFKNFIALFGILACSPFALAQPGTQLWEFPSLSILSSPAIAPDGTIYVGCYDRKLYALTPAGDIKWTFPLPTADSPGTYTGIFSSPAIGLDGTVYFGAENGYVYALNPTNGASKWAFAAGDAVYSDPAIGPDGAIYIGSYSNPRSYLYAINTNGTQRWRYEPADAIYSDPVIALDGTIYFGCDDGKLYSLNTNGTLRWSFNTGIKAITASPSIGADGKIYVGVGSSTNPRMFCVNTNGTTNWIFTATNRIKSSAAIAADGTVYFGSDDNHLYALNPNGTLKWSALTGGTNGSSPAIAADGTIYIGCDDRKLYAFNSSGSNVWSFLAAAEIYSSPVIATNGTVYVGSGPLNGAAGSSGGLYAISGNSRLGSTPWPMFRHNANHTARRTNSAPIVPDDVAATDLNTPLSLSIAKLLIKATDQEGDSLSITSATSTNGGAVMISGGVLTYTPVSNYSGADRIDFSVSDSFLTVTSHVFVTVRAATTQSYNILGVMNNGGSSVTITFAGIPNRYYIVESTTNLTAPTPPNWVKIFTNRAGANGIWSCIDPISEGSKYYRSTGGTISAP